MTALTIILALIILGIIIAVHEFGHFIVAKATGVRVEEFSIGLGPVIVGKKWGETYYSLRAIPIGGFNKMSGMESEVKDPKGFNNKPVSKRAAVIASGSLMNFVLAIVLFVIVFGFVGMPADVNVVGEVIPGKPAEEAGLQAGDKILAVEEEEVASWVGLTEKIHENPGQELTLKVERDDKVFTVNVVPEKDPERGVGLIGIMNPTERVGLFEAVYEGITQAVSILVFIVISIVQMITGQMEAELAGPVGIVSMVGEYAALGLNSILSFTALLSLNIGLLNLLPIPALDGSRLIFLGIEGLRGKKIAAEKENIIHFIGFMLLILLLVFVTYQDIFRLTN